MADKESPSAETRPNYRYFIAFISKECSGYQHRNDIVTCDEKIETKEDLEHLESFLASKTMASKVVIQNIQPL